ncbi:uncharacterized protein I303_107670 [Kwoniella dejecticola CBS 10117]|uniref:Uncharacterized protein n=1 Tax=Kwoniella dejecticola CBS 10117 TaxID=1296121 RepID=A0AAJ8MIU7_9TREE
MRKAAEEGKGQVLVPEEGDCFINSNIKMKWQIPFGYPPNQVSFHTAFSMTRFLRVFPANPASILPSGHSVSDRDSPVDRVEMVFSVPKAAEDVFYRLVERDKVDWKS